MIKRTRKKENQKTRKEHEQTNYPRGVRAQAVVQRELSSAWLRRKSISIEGWRSPRNWSWEMANRKSAISKGSLSYLFRSWDLIDWSTSVPFIPLSIMRSHWLIFVGSASHLFWSWDLTGSLRLDLCGFNFVGAFYAKVRLILLLVPVQMNYLV